MFVSHATPHKGQKQVRFPQTLCSWATSAWIAAETQTKARPTGDHTMMYRHSTLPRFPLKKNTLEKTAPQIPSPCGCHEKRQAKKKMIPLHRAAHFFFPYHSNVAFWSNACFPWAHLKKPPAKWRIMYSLETWRKRRNYSPSHFQHTIRMSLRYYYCVKTLHFPNSSKALQPIPSGFPRRSTYIYGMHSFLQREILLHMQSMRNSPRCLLMVTTLVASVMSSAVVQAEEVGSHGVDVNADTNVSAIFQNDAANVTTLRGALFRYPWVWPVTDAFTAQPDTTAMTTTPVSTTTVSTTPASTTTIPTTPVPTTTVPTTPVPTTTVSTTPVPTTTVPTTPVPTTTVPTTPVPTTTVPTTPVPTTTVPTTASTTTATTASTTTKLTTATTAVPVSTVNPCVPFVGGVAVLNGVRLTGTVVPWQPSPPTIVPVAPGTSYAFYGIRYGKGKRFQVKKKTLEKTWRMISPSQAKTNTHTVRNFSIFSEIKKKIFYMKKYENFSMFSTY